MTVSERVYYVVCRLLGRVLRAARYSAVSIVDVDGELQVRKRRSFFAPVLITLGDALIGVLDTGMHVLPQRDWEQREILLYETLYGMPVRVDRGGTLVLPYLAGETLATLLDDPTSGPAARAKAIELAVAALVDFHARGFTHGDAMADNVMVDLDAGVARWFDFETVHDTNRPVPWRKADDVRALLSTTLLRTSADELAETLQLVVDGYADDGVTRLVEARFASIVQRPLTFHIGQAPLPLERFRAIAQLLSGRIVD